jgi:hypothetical protein
MTLPPSGPPPVEPYRPLNARRRLLLVALALATAATVLWMLFERPGAPPPPPRVEPPRCAPGQTLGCVGGTAAIIMPTASAASR